MTALFSSGGRRSEAPVYNTTPHAGTSVINSEGTLQQLLATLNAPAGMTADAGSAGFEDTMQTESPLYQAIRAQGGGSGGGTGNWDDAGFDRAQELTDLLSKAGVSEWGELSFVNTPYDKDYLFSSNYAFANNTDGAEPNYDAILAELNANGGRKQLQIGDKTVGYLGDYNNDGSYGNKAQDYLTGSSPEENLLAWSARGEGNTSYRVITDPTTGKLAISPGWNSSSDAGSARDLAKGAAFVAASGMGMQALFPGAAVAGSGGATLGKTGTALLKTAGKSALTNAGVTAIQGGRTNDILKSALIGGVSGGIGAANLAGTAGLAGTSAQVANNAISGAVRAALAGGNVGQGALMGGVGTGIRGLNLPGQLGINNKLVADMLNSSLIGGVGSTVRGGKFLQGAEGGALQALISSSVNNLGQRKP